jgi:hypothetical protein
MSTGERTPCPYCGESILSGAAKCRSCGEWLVSPRSAHPSVREVSQRVGADWSERGTPTARAVSKGMKEKELDDWMVNLLLRVGAVGAVVLMIVVGAVLISLGVSGWLAVPIGFFVGVVLIVKLGCRLGRSYYRE